MVTLASTLALAMPGVVGSASPSSSALTAFEAIRAAQAAGADVNSLVAQYNSLLQSNAPDSSFDMLRNQALGLQQTASSQTATSNAYVAESIPLIALALALITELVFQIRSKVARERRLSREVLQP